MICRNVPTDLKQTWYDVCSGSFVTAVVELREYFNPNTEEYQTKGILGPPIKIEYHCFRRAEFGTLLSDTVFANREQAENWIKGFNRE